MREDERRAVCGRFSQNLRRIRLERELSQEDMARLCDIHRTEVSALERGRREPRISILVKLSSVLDVPIEDLLEGIGWTPTDLPAAAPGRFRVLPVDKGSKGS